MRNPIVSSLGVGCLLAVIPFAACSGGGGSSSSSSTSGGSSNGAYTQFCKDSLSAAICQPTPCDTFTHAQCLAAYDAYCATYGEQVDGWLRAGKATFHADRAAPCAAEYQAYGRAVADYGCTGDLAAFMRALTGVDPAAPAVCANGIPQTASPGYGFSNCQLLLQGTVADGASCEDPLVCASGDCEGRPDGGCGHCGAGNVHNGPANVGESCVQRYDGGAKFFQCVAAASCSPVTDRCIPDVAPGASCGAAVAACSVACGLYCAGEDRDGGTGVCTENPTEGGACGYVSAPTAQYVSCAQGLSCVMVASDAGYYDHSTCVSNATAGQPCSLGYNNDLNPQGTGAMSQGRFPVCAGSHLCNVPDGGIDGTCSEEITAGAATGAPCNALLENPCANPLDVCDGYLSLGHCARRPGPGEPCGGYVPCQQSLICQSTAGPGPSVCVAKIALGQPCTDRDTCVDLALCSQGQCKAYQDATIPPLPACQ